MKNSCASCCLLVENSGWPRPITDLNIWGAMPSCSWETNQVLKVKYCHYIVACVASFSDWVIARKLARENTKLEEGEVEGEGFPFLPFLSLFFNFFSSRSNFLDELAQKRTLANPIFAVWTSNGRNKARDVAHVIPFILKLHYICWDRIVYTYLTVTRPKWNLGLWTKLDSVTI